MFVTSRRWFFLRIAPTYLVLKYLANNRYTFGSIDGNREKLTEEIHDAIQLKDHPDYWPAAHNQRYPQKKGYDTTKAVTAREESILGGDYGRGGVTVVVVVSFLCEQIKGGKMIE